MDVLEYRRNGCFGTCPSYEVLVFPDGVVLFRQRQPTTKIAITHVSPSMLNQLVSLFSEFNVGNTYSEQACYDVTDHPSIQARMTWQGKTASMNHYLGCRKTPQRLKTVEARVEKLLVEDTHFVH